MPPLCGARRRPEALAAQLVHVGQLGLLPLLQLHAYLALLYYDSFAAVGDICPDFQVGSGWHVFAGVGV